MTDQQMPPPASPPAVPVKAELRAGPHGLQFTTFEGMYRFACVLEKSGFAPKGMTPPAIVAAIQYGAEVGLSPMQALTKIAVINGRPAIFGDAMLALAQKHPLWGGHVETSGHSEKFGRWAKCEITRRGDSNHIAVFTEAMAKQAGLWGKSGPWTQYPGRMLQMRARSWALRNSFPDALGGLIAAEEADDSPPPQWRTAEVKDRQELPTVGEFLPEPEVVAEPVVETDTQTPEPVAVATSLEEREKKWRKIAQQAVVSEDQEDPPEAAQEVLFEES